MGNYKFRLSQMIPNSWFYKLKDNTRRSTTTTITTTTTTRAPKRILHHPKPTTKEFSSIHPHTTQPCQQLYIPNRPSFYFPSNDQREKLSSSPAHPSASDTHFPIDLPKKSKKPNRRKPFSSSTKPISSVIKSGHLNNSPSSASTDITFDVQTQSPTMSFDDVLSQHRLPPILTKPLKKEAEKTAEVQNKHVMQRRAQQGLRRIKVRHGSSKLELKRMAEASSNRLADSFVIVKRSADPMTEFRESMVEMIVENDLRATKDLEELLVCYLSLNSDEYHGLIVQVFEEILINLRDAEV